MCQYGCCVGRMYHNTTIIFDLTFSNGGIDDRVL